jgi:hypothetical protein
MQVPIWLAAAQGQSMDWRSVFVGYRSQVDWPGARYWRKLADTFPARATIAPHRLLIFDVSHGWEPLCAFLRVQVPEEPFPKTNSVAEFLAGTWLRRPDRSELEPPSAQLRHR